MRKHLFGLAIFISIVTAAVLVYGYFNTPPIPVIPAVDYPKDDRKGIILYCEEFTGLIYRLSASEFDVRTGAFRTQIDVKWTGEDLPPGSLYMTVFLMDDTEERAIFSTKMVYLKDVFEKKGWNSVTVTLNGVDQTNFKEHGNVYSFVEFSSSGRSDLGTSLYLRKGLAELTPVLLVHDGQAVRAEPGSLE